jgi:hypothetical protein
MAQAQWNLKTGAAEDVAQVLHVLHHAGPVPLSELGDDPELAEWSSERIEHALVSAWSRALIFIDSGDMLVAL